MFVHDICLFQNFDTDSFKCSFCSFWTNNHEELIRHYNFHEHLPNFSIRCMWCPQTLKNVKYLRRYNKCCSIKSQKKNIIVDSTYWICPKSDCRSKISISNLATEHDFVKIKKHCFTHFRSSPRSDFVACPICAKSFSTYKSYSSHVLVHQRKGEYQVKTSRTLEGAQGTHNSGFISGGTVEETEVFRNETSTKNQELVSETARQNESVMVDHGGRDLNHLMSTFTLKLEGKHMLPNHVISDILSHMNFVSDLRVKTVLRAMSSDLGARHKMSLEEARQIEDSGLNINSVMGLRSEVDTEAKRKSYLKRNFDFIEPEKIILGQVQGESSFYYYFPIIKTLLRLLRDDNLRNYATFLPFHEPRRPSRVYQGFQDGKVFRKMDIQLPTILVRLYLDGFATNNPLGSSADKDKIVGIYYTILHNLKVSAKRNLVQTVCLIKQSDISFFGLDSCLRQLTDEMKGLVNNGFFEPHCGLKFGFRLISVLGDNLSQNEVAGLPMNFSKSQYSCRHCFCSLSNLHAATSFEDICSENFEKRTKQSYERHVEAMEEGILEKQFGVKRRSPFLDIPYFDIGKQLPQCFSHDLYEGCLKLYLQMI